VQFHKHALANHCYGCPLVKRCLGIVFYYHHKREPKALPHTDYITCPRHRRHTSRAQIKQTEQHRLERNASPAVRAVHVPNTHIQQLLEPRSPPPIHRGKEQIIQEQITSLRCSPGAPPALSTSRMVHAFARAREAFTRADAPAEWNRLPPLKRHTPPHMPFRLPKQQLHTSRRHTLSLSLISRARGKRRGTIRKSSPMKAHQRTSARPAVQVDSAGHKTTSDQSRACGQP